MLNSTDTPVEWTLMLDDIRDAADDLRRLYDRMHEQGTIEDAEMRVDLGHVYAHLNRAWFGFSKGVDVLSDWEQASRFPTDLEPIG